MRQLGATPQAGGTQFCVWAPGREALSVVLEREELPMEKDAEGYFTLWVAHVKPGDRYRYRVDGEGPFPDPASRFQPEGVHGPSEVVDPGAFHWTARHWKGAAAGELAIYELHIGAFTPEGTFEAAARRLPWLKQLGVTAVEVMPVADFAGDWNWGYDGVCPFAPARCYGTPDDFRRFVDQAHLNGLAVILDVVYNHFGPDGAYQGVYSPRYFSSHHPTPWGDGFNFDGEASRAVRDYFIQNAVRWVREYRIDGLRLDATQNMMDESERHILAEIGAAFREAGGSWLIAEDMRNQRNLLLPESEGGMGLTGVWADDFHHQIRRALAGDHEAYYRDYEGADEDIAETMRRGWFYHGQQSQHLQAPRGTDPEGLPYSSFVYCIQNHDQVGNRAYGERLHHQIDLAAYRAASTLLLLAPHTPMLFMGQEWAASSPFLFFTNHHDGLGHLVTAGRRREFGRFRAFADPELQARIPDPQSPQTFADSKLKWAELDREPHASIHRLYQALLALRRAHPSSATHSPQMEIAAAEGAITFRRGDLLVVVRLRGEGETVLPDGQWRPILTTEEAGFAQDPVPPVHENGRLRLGRPGAAVFQAD